MNAGEIYEPYLKDKHTFFGRVPGSLSLRQPPVILVETGHLNQHTLAILVFVFMSMYIKALQFNNIVYLCMN